MEKMKKPKLKLCRTPEMLEAKLQALDYPQVIVDNSGVSTEYKGSRKESKSLTVRISNDFINAGYSYSIPELSFKILMYSLTKINLKDEKFIPLELDLNTFHDLLPSKRTALSTEIKPHIEKLGALKIEFKTGETLWLNIFSWIVYKPYERVIVYKFNDDFKPWFLQLKRNFTLPDMKSILKMTGKYTGIFYLLTKSHVGLGKRRILIDDLYNIFGIKGNEKSFTHFKIHLDTAIDQINEFSDITIIDYNLFKTGHKITGIEFSMRKKPRKIKRKKPIEDDHPISTKIIKQFFEKEILLEKDETWETSYAEGAKFMHVFFEEEIKDQKCKIPNQQWRRNEIEFLKEVAFEYIRNQKTPLPTYLHSAKTKQGIRNFIKDNY